MTTDGGLRQLFRKHVPDADWQAVETGGTGLGIPDLNYCLSGQEGWIELKQTDAWAVEIRPEQIAWAERRTRHGGRVLLAVRRRHPGSIRRVSCDELWVFQAQQMRLVMTMGLKRAEAAALLVCEGGPARWFWLGVRDLMTRPIAKLGEA